MNWPPTPRWPAACRSALTLYAGDLLPGATYETWAEQPRQRLRTKFLRLLRAAGQFERLLAEDPADDEACAALMRSELAAGRSSAVLRWYGLLRDTLQQSLNLSPGIRVTPKRHQCHATMKALRTSLPRVPG